MKISRVRKMYNTEFDKLIARQHGEQFLKDYKQTYYYSKLFEVISDNDIYVRDYERPKPKYRITFPFFLLAVLAINIFMCVYWLFTGTITVNHKWWIAKKMIAWDKACNFNIVR